MTEGGIPVEPDPRLRAASAHVLVDAAALDGDGPLRLPPLDAHHLVRVLRLRPDELVTATDGAGRWRPCRLTADAVSASGSGSSGASGGGGGRRRDGAPGAALVPLGPVEHVRAPGPVVTVAFAPVKGDRPEWVVQKLTEVGVDRIVLLEAERSVVRWEGDRAGRQVERLRLVAREALQQCRRVHLPSVEGPWSLEALADEAARDGYAVALAEPGASEGPRLSHPVVAVGPEGGWSPSELSDRTQVGLGPATLRAETASLVVGSLLCALRSGTVGTPT